MTSVSPPVPVDEVTSRPLQFVWLTDFSGSMAGSKIATLNQAIREAVPEIRSAVSNYPKVAVFMRAIRFSDGAEWHVGPDPVPIDEFRWPELGIAGGTSTAKAIRLLASELETEKMPRRGFPPVCILVSDGFSTDPPEEYESAIADLNSLPWGKKAVRLAIAIGDESEYDVGELLMFVNHPEVGVLKADSPEKLVQYIKWVSVSATRSSTAGLSKNEEGSGEESNIVLPPIPELDIDVTDPF